jgi:threonylcarbamoyladenosine tRNA methylthiotransferase MtaB
MSGHLHPAIVRERAELLRSLAAKKRAAFQARFITRSLHVLGQRHNSATGLMTGLSRNYLEIGYLAPATLLNREVVVQIDTVSDGQLRGRCILPLSR